MGTSDCGAGTASDCFYWVGMTGEKLVKPATGVLTQKDGKLMNGSTAFVWTGYSSDNGWTIPTEPLQLPYLAGTPNRASMTLSSTAVITHTVTLEYPAANGNGIEYSFDNTTWTTYTENIPIVRMAAKHLQYMLKRRLLGCV